MVSMCMFSFIAICCLLLILMFSAPLFTRFLLLLMMVLICTNKRSTLLMRYLIDFSLFDDYFGLLFVSSVCLCYMSLSFFCLSFCYVHPLLFFVRFLLFPFIQVSSHFNFLLSSIITSQRRQHRSLRLHYLIVFF